ncbi:MAG: ABC transporter permease [Arenicellales bacterium]|nr:ABC transporter permease [Arenicellales bacterium]MDP6768283.1 ABC transporter permease [Arenicellales bacterium]
MSSGLWGMIIKRLAFGLLTLFAISLLITVGMEFLAGDVCTEMLGQMAQPDTVAACRAELNLDRPVHIRYAEWVWNLLHGDMGVSLANRREVSELISRRIGNTLFLAGMSAVVSVPLAIGLGVLAALYRNTAFDRVISITTLSTISVPEFFVAYILMALLAVNFQVFPAISNVDSFMGFFERVKVSALPVLTLTLVVLAHMMRMTRASIVNLLASPYIEMAKLKGIRPARIILWHALPNAWAPIIQVVILNLAWLVVGVVIVEVVFVYPGLGYLMVDSVLFRDMPMVRGTAMVFATTYVLLNLLADILSIIANPRLRHRR